MKRVLLAAIVLLWPLALSWVAAQEPAGPTVVEAAPAADDQKTDAEAEPSDELTDEAKAAILQKIAPAAGSVEFTLRFDKGEPPRRGAGAAGGGRYEGRYYGGSLAYLVEQERPLELPAYLIAPQRVLVPDAEIHPRFIRAIHVRFGTQRIAAKPAAYAMDADVTLLELTEPVKDAQPLSFDGQAEGPYQLVRYDPWDGQWVINLKPLKMNVAHVGSRAIYRPSVAGGVGVTQQGRPVGFVARDLYDSPDGWKGSPLQWKCLSAADMDKALAQLEKVYSQGVVRVALSFRSPRKDAARGGYESGDDDGKTERNELGVVLGPQRVLVLANLGPKVTARLERIVVHVPGSEPVPATFELTLEDYGAFTAVPSQPLSGALKLSDEPITDYRGTLLLSAEPRLQGEKLTTYFSHGRIRSFELGWKRQVFPEIFGSEQLLLFDLNDRLVALPIARRQKVAMRESYGRREPALTPAGHIGKLLDDLAAHADASNVPLSEEEENRLAWFGVELQRLDPELARINKVSDLTQDGQFGALVSFVYPDSPAAEAGVQVGDILLRIYAEGEPKPIEVQAEESLFANRPFPWGQWDQLPERLYDRFPHPWPSAENFLNRTLTDLGFG